jgi:DeoR/GlpR family transcriptional regulator of sugar metabolism
VRVPFHIVQARRERLAQLIEQHRYLPIKDLCRHLGVSEATARRDLAALVQEKKITRTHGGVFSDFNDRFPSFRERRGRGSDGKTKIARAALGLIEPGLTCFFDSGTTICAVAEAFAENPVTPLTVVTSNLPVGELLAAIPGVSVFLVAGQLLHLQSTLLGEAAKKSLEFWTFDRAFLSAEGMDRAGLWNSQDEIVDQQHVVLKRSRLGIFCLDGSKLGKRAPHFLLPWSQVDLLLTDLSLEEARAGEVMIDEGHFASADRPDHALGKNLPERMQAQAAEEKMPVHYL